ncbi:MAG: hypothetical protein A2099_02025 [Planctomycetes bacterium GWF2_39_10]|nr:MAG: hypothetical protein A2Y09_05360 [Planctomycetes bacterium GWA2_39_15]OHB48955.1 MAG: hypothetical protein A2099_02025 [Planctomycetes bacterium GWF2_39_10]
MKKAAIIVSDFYLKNRMFDLNDPVSNRDNISYSNYLLKTELLKSDIDLSTQDINKVQDSNIVFFNDMPSKIPVKKKGQKFYLFAMESIAVHPINFDLKRYVNFDKVFTWKDDITDGNKVIKINYSFQFNPIIKLELGKENKLVFVMAGNKYSKHEHELYSHRIEIINWFEKNHPEDFGLFGVGWDMFQPKNIFCKMINRTKMSKLFMKDHLCYRGIAISKKSVYPKYKFNICYENVKDIPGYITDKIFDCFFAGCVPIYWGANNVTDHIPKNCFIDKRDFDSYEVLYEFIKNMDDTTYQQYLKNAQEYLNSPMSYGFTAECFVKTIISEIANV